MIANRFSDSGEMDRLMNGEGLWDAGEEIRRESMECKP